MNKHFFVPCIVLVFCMEATLSPALPREKLSRREVLIRQQRLNAEICKTIVENDSEALKKCLSNESLNMSLLHRSPTGTPFMLAATLGRLDLISLLLAAGAKPNETNHVGISALGIACANGSPDAVIDMLLAIPDISVTHSSFFKQTALHAAATTGNLKAIKKLIDHVSPEDRIQFINQQDYLGETALMDALATKRTLLYPDSAKQIAIFLLENGALPTLQDRNGFTASMLLELLLINPALPEETRQVLCSIVDILKAKAREMQTKNVETVHVLEETSPFPSELCHLAADYAGPNPADEV